MSLTGPMILFRNLSLAKNKIVQFTNISINDIIRKISPLIFADAIKSDKEIILDLGDIPKLPLEEKEIRQLLLNLVRNGLDAMLPAGILCIRTHRSGNEVVLKVEDTGSGIPDEVIDKIGQPFITTKENGTGLGLSVCYSICARHNAKLDYKTSKEGTTFYVRFPILKGKV
jgi:signal transduction histidine kinase